MRALISSGVLVFSVRCTLNAVRCTKHGFTLIELMMAATIGVFVFGAITSLLMSGLGAVKSVGQFHITYSDARKAMQYMNRDVKESYSILNTQAIDGVTYQTDKDTLVLQRSGGGGGDYDFVVYDLVPDGTDYLGSNQYRMERTFFDNYTVAGVAKTGSTSSKRVIAKNVVAPSGSDYIFNSAGTKVSVDLTISKVERKAKHQVVALDASSQGNYSNSGEGATTLLRLVSEIKMRN